MPLHHRPAAPPQAELFRAKLTKYEQGEEEAAEPPAPAATNIIPKDNDEKSGSFSAQSIVVNTVLEPGAAPRTTVGGSAPGGTTHRTKYQTVNPSGAPATGDGSNDCLPANSTVAWDVVSKSATQWGVNVTALTLSGTVNVKPWPSDPTHMVVPNTANPVDGGNITDAAGSANNWQAAINDMADYNTAGGGAGPNWHSTGASHAHEWAHWNTDWIADSINSAVGGNWPKANRDLDALREPKASSATAADAKTALQAKVDARMGTFEAKTSARWNAIPDTPGVAGSTGYVAGAAVLSGLIAAVRDYAIVKGWAAPPPAPGPGHGHAPGP